jgi:dihydrofolate reductase
MRKLIYYVACTVDGFIARKDGSFDCFLMEGEHYADLLAYFPETFPAHFRDAFGVHTPNQRFDSVLMGRATYEVGVNLGVTNPYPHLKQYLFSRTLLVSPDVDVELVSLEAVARVKELKRDSGKDIWLCGGSELATDLFSEIDELILKVNPVVIGEGIPLFRREVGPTMLELIESKSYCNGFMMNHYDITAL